MTTTPAGRRGPERVSLNLSQVSVVSLTVLTETCDMTKTEAINKALQFYGMIRTLAAAGGGIYIQESEAEGLERVRIF